jgi:NAD(P)H-flavin reductase
MAKRTTPSPLISILDHLDRTETLPPKVSFLYSTKAGEMSLDMNRILFLSKLVDVESRLKPRVSITLFITDMMGKKEAFHGMFPQYQGRRLSEADLAGALRGGDTQRTVCYVCGPPTMTDQTVSFLVAQQGMVGARVLCEKWW